jgi:hypothetical protein
MDWKETVNTYDDIATTYPTPDDGWTVNVKDTDITYRYDSTLKVWIPISANSIPLATSSVDGKMSKADKAKLDGIESGAEVNPTATEILNSLKTVDGSGSGLDADLFKGKSDSYYLDYNNFSNVPDVYTKTEINTQMNGKVDKVSGKGLSANDFDNTYKSKVDGIASGATKVEDSTINGNIKINGVENVVYTHPTNAIQLDDGFDLNNLAPDPYFNGIYYVLNPLNGVSGWDQHIIVQYKTYQNRLTEVIQKAMQPNSSTNNIYYRKRVGGAWGVWTRIALKDELDTAIATTMKNNTDTSTTGNLTVGKTLTVDDTVHSTNDITSDNNVNAIAFKSGNFQIGYNADEDSLDFSYVG